MSKYHNTQTLEILSIFGIFILSSFFILFLLLPLILAKIVLIVSDEEYKVNSATNIVVGFDIKLSVCSMLSTMSMHL